MNYITFIIVFMALLHNIEGQLTIWPPPSYGVVLNKKLMGLNSKRNPGTPRSFIFFKYYGSRSPYFTIPKHFVINITPNNYAFPDSGGTKQFTVSLTGTHGYNINDQNPVTIKFLSALMNSTFINHSDDNTNFAPPDSGSDYGTEITFNNTTETKTFSLHCGPLAPAPGTQTGNLISVMPVQIGSKIIYYNPTWNIVQKIP